MNRENATLFGLCLAAGSVACIMTVLGRASWLEAVSFVTGAACVWLTVRENVWNFPIGLANVATFSVVFFEARLFADAGLQLVYFALGVMGWYLWLFGGEGRTALAVRRASTRELCLVGCGVLVATLGLWLVLERIGGSASFWDALTTSLSLASQWLLNRKRIESWLGWIIVDVIYVPLYVSKELYLTAALYALFLAMAVLGWRAWQKSLKRREESLVMVSLSEAAIR